MLVITILVLSVDESLAGSRFIFSVKEVQVSMRQHEKTSQRAAKEIFSAHILMRNTAGILTGLLFVPKAIDTHLKGFGNYIKAGRRK